MSDPFERLRARHDAGELSDVELESLRQQLVADPARAAAWADDMALDGWLAAALEAPADATAFRDAVRRRVRETADGARFGRLTMDRIRASQRRPPHEAITMQMTFTEAEQAKTVDVPPGPFTIGRNKGCGLPVRDLSISKQHCEAEVRGRALHIRDLGSRNGTWVNGDRIADDYVAVRPGDQLIVGKVAVQLNVVGEPVADAQIEGTMADPEFGSSAAWSPPPGAERGPDTRIWDQSFEVAREMASGDYAHLLRGEIVEPGQPAVRLQLQPGSHVIGTDRACSVRLSASGVSSAHAKLVYTGGGWQVEDLGSRNGTFLNKKTVNRAALVPGDQLLLGPVRIDIAAAVEAGDHPLAAAVARPGLAPLRRVAIAVGLLLVLVTGGLVALRKPPGEGAAGGKTQGNVSEQLYNTLKPAMEKLAQGEWDSARNFLRGASELEPDLKTVRTLLQVTTWLSEDPTDHIEDLIEAGSYLSSRQGKLWRDAGVIAFGAALKSDWEEERENAKHAAEGDEYFARQNWLRAWAAYRRISRKSAFYGVKRAQTETAARQITEQQITEAERLYAQGEADKALSKLAVAGKYATAGQQTRINNLQIAIETNKTFANYLVKAREGFNTQNFKAALDWLDRIPPASDYATAAAALRERSQQLLIEREAKALYRQGKGPEAINLLRTAVKKNLQDLRELIERVHGLYTQATELKQKKQYESANEIWQTIIRMVDDPDNQYQKIARASIQIDPTRVAARQAKEAEQLYRAGKRLEAARKIFEALQQDSANASAVRLRDKMRRKINLDYQILRQKWIDKRITSAEFLAQVKESHAIIKAMQPTSPLAEKMEAAIKQAGG